MHGWVIISQHFYLLAFQAEGVLSLPASVHLSVRPSVFLSVRPKLYLVRTITHHRFGLESPNLHQTCILEYSQLVLKTEVIDLDLQGHFGHFELEFLEIWLVSLITCNGLELKSPNLHQICILGFFRMVLKIEVIGLNFQGLAIILTHETAFNVALVYWYRLAKGCYKSQTCYCRCM